LSQRPSDPSERVATPAAPEVPPASADEDDHFSLEDKAAPITEFPPDERFRLLVNAVDDYAIFHLDVEGRVASWNQGAARIKGYRADEILGRHFSAFYLPEEVERGKPPWELEVATREGRFEDEGWRVRKDGSLFWANVVITALRDQTGELVGFAKVTRDLTERRRAEQTRLELARSEAAREAAEAAERRASQLADENAQLYQQAVEALRAREEFLAVAAHELKTPLTGLRLTVQLMQRTIAQQAGLTPEMAGELLDRILRQSTRLGRLIEQLLDLSRLEAGHLVISREETDLTRLVQEAADMVGSQSERHVVRTHAPDDDVVGLVDPIRVEQVVVNLIDNAIRYSPEGGTIDVTVARPDPGTVRISVRDRGIGIPPEHRDRVFDRFYQVNADNPGKGMGLGLYISSQIIALHGGTLVLATPPDGGAEFILSLPLVDPPKHESEPDNGA
jgi:PAS domain S-box-containing protein